MVEIFDVMNLAFILSCLFNFKGDNPTYLILLKKNFNVGLYSDIWKPNYFKFDVIIETTKLYILLSVWMTLTFIQGHSCIRNEKLDVCFLAN